MTLAAAAPYAVASAGLVVVAGWAALSRAGRDPLGPQPRGRWPDTTVPTLVALLAWFLLPMLLLGLTPLGERSAFAQTTVVALVHTAVALRLMPFVRRGAPVPAISGRRLAAAGVLAGLATYGVVGVVGELLRAGYGIAGAAAPEQDIVGLARRASGPELAGFVASTVILAPFAEEVFWRGGFLSAALAHRSVRFAITVQAAAFGAVHVWDGPPSRWPLAIPLAVVGWIAGWLCVRTGSLAPSMLLHAVFNGLHLAFLRRG